MKSTLLRGVWAIASLAALVSPVCSQATPTDETDGQPTSDTGAGLTLRTPKSLGCFSSPGDMTDMGPYTFQAMGWCQPLCVRLAKPYLAFVNGTNCFCGDNPPGSSDKTDDSDCQSPCQGFPNQACGGTNNWAVYNDGFVNGDPTGTVSITVPVQTPQAAAESIGTSSLSVVSTAIVTKSGGQTVPTVIEVTETAQPSSDPSGGSNKVGIAVGVTVAVVAVAVVIGALFFWMRHRKNRAIQEERDRLQSMTNTVTGEKPGSSYSLGDSRLNQSVMFQRRQSDGSIADNEDYSRRILQVTNPDYR